MTSQTTLFVAVGRRVPTGAAVPAVAGDASVVITAPENARWDDRPRWKRLSASSESAAPTACKEEPGSDVQRGDTASPSLVVPLEGTMCLGEDFETALALIVELEPSVEILMRNQR